MPYQISIPLALDEKTTLQKCDLLRPWHAMFYAWLEAGNAELAHHIHDTAEPKPFTVGFLESTNEHELKLPITLLDDSLWQPFQNGLFRNNEYVVQGQTFCIGKDLDVQHLTYEALWERARPDSSITLRFASPASFHTQGHHYPLPDPFLVFQSYLLRWNHFVPEPLQININLLDAVNAHVVVADYQLRTKSVDFGGYRQIGCLGTVRYQILERAKLGNLVRRLNTLADYAPFCGTGHKTTQGMGRTLRIERKSTNL